MDEIDAHGFVLITDAAHFFVKIVSSREIINLEGQVKFIIAKVVWIFMVFKPGQFKLMEHLAIAKKDQNETTVWGFNTPLLNKLQSILVEGQTFLQIEDIEIIVGESKLHSLESSLVNMVLTGYAYN
jgi:hypothetical protein